MPELPEVETVKNGIAAFIGYAKIIKVKINNHKFRETIPEGIEAILEGATIIGYRRIGKYIIIELDNNQSVIWHLGMSGRIKTFKKLPDNIEKHDHIIIETEQGCLIYNDPRRFGLFTYAETAHLDNVKCLSGMGIDPFDKKLDSEYPYTKLKHKKIPIKVALLDQKIINGIGNIYASEILYASKITPLRSADNISLDECRKIIKNTREVLQKAIDNGGSTLRDYHKPDGSTGNFQNLHCVYDRTGQRCPDCNCGKGSITKIIQAGRSTFYCPFLQK